MLSLLEKQCDALAVSGFAGDVQEILLQRLHDPSSPLSEEDIITLESAKKFLGSAETGWASASRFIATGKPSSNFRDMDNTDICSQILDISPEAPVDEFNKVVDKICSVLDACLKGNIHDMAFEKTANVRLALQFFHDMSGKYLAKSCAYY